MPAGTTQDKDTNGRFLMKADLPSPVEYRVMVLIASEKHGRDIAKLYHERYGEAISYGTLYVTLRRLRDNGWVDVRAGQPVAAQVTSTAKAGSSRTTLPKSGADARFRSFKLTSAGKRAWNRSRDFYIRLATIADTAMA